jgi:tripartite ATP-independent transporter DctM subunit
LTAIIYALMIIIRCKLKPELAPPVTESATWVARMRALLDVWPVLLLVLGIIGGLYAGVMTPTEAGGFGAFLAFIIAFIQGRLSIQSVKDSISESVSATARIFFVAIGAVLLTKFLALTGLSGYLGAMVGSWALDPILLILAASLVYLLLGMFLDPIGVLLLTLPILLPMFEALNMDLVWVGVILVKYIEIGLLTPPVGFNVYVIKSVVGNDISLETIFKGVFWFLMCEVAIMALLIGFPQISLYLPSQM